MFLFLDAAEKMLCLHLKASRGPRSEIRLSWTCPPRVRCFKYVTDTHIHTYEGWNFTFGNAAVTFDTAHLQSSSIFSQTLDVRPKVM